MDYFIYILMGIGVYIFFKYIVRGFYIVNQNERAVKTVFGKAQRIAGKTTLDDPISEGLDESERLRYTYPMVKVIMPGGPYFKFPWQRVYKVSIAIETANMAYDPENPKANHNNMVLDAVTKDQLNIGLTGQIRYRVSDRNLYAYIFGVKNPIAYIMGYFVSVLRERIANFEGQAPEEDSDPDSGMSKMVQGISINDLRKNLRDLNDHMDHECRVSAARYGVALEASLITGIDPPEEVESALAAINTAHNQVSSDISLAQASADQRIVESKRAVEIETLKAQGEIETLEKLSSELNSLKKKGGKEALDVYVRNIKLALLDQTTRIVRRQRQ